MHKMLDDYFENYKCFGNRDKLLDEDKEYIQLRKNINELKEKIYSKLSKVLDEKDTDDLLDKLDNLYWDVKEISEKDAFEFGFHTGMQIGMNVVSSQRIVKHGLE